MVSNWSNEKNKLQLFQFKKNQNVLTWNASNAVLDDAMLYAPGDIDEFDEFGVNGAYAADDDETDDGGDDDDIDSGLFCCGVPAPHVLLMLELAVVATDDDAANVLVKLLNPKMSDMLIVVSPTIPDYMKK